MPVGTARFDNAILEGLALLNWYAREHVMLCLVPAFFIAGAIAVFISQNAVMKYLGPPPTKPPPMGWPRCPLDLGGMLLHRAALVRRHLSARRGTRPSHCVSLFRPAINVLAIVLTAKILGGNWAWRGRWAR